MITFTASFNMPFYTLPNDNNNHASLMASFQGQRPKASNGKFKLFWIFMVAVASAGPHANHLHLAPDR